MNGNVACEWHVRRSADVSSTSSRLHAERSATTHGCRYRQQHRRREEVGEGVGKRTGRDFGGGGFGYEGAKINKRSAGDFGRRSYLHTMPAQYPPPTAYAA